MVGFVFASKHKEMEAPTKEGRSTHTDRKELIALLVAMLVLVALGVAYATNTHPPYYVASKGGDYLGKDDSHLAEGLDGWVGRWLGVDKDPGEPSD